MALKVNCTLCIISQSNSEPVLTLINRNNRQASSQIDRQTHSQTDTHSQRDRKTDKRTIRKRDRQTGKVCKLSYLHAISGNISIIIITFNRVMFG